MEILFNEVEVWDSFRKGSESAYALIYEMYTRVLYIYGCRLSSDKELVKDCIQDLFVNLWHSKSSLSATDSITYYLFRSLRRELVRKSKPQGAVVTYADNQVENSFEEKWIGYEENYSVTTAMNAAMEHLSDRQREVVFLRFYQNMEFEEIAQVMEITPRAVYKLVYRAIDVLQKYYFPQAAQDTPSLYISHPELQLYFIIMLICLEG